MDYFFIVLIAVPVIWCILTIRMDRYFDTVTLFWKWKNNEATKHYYYASYVVFWIGNLSILAMLGWFCSLVMNG